jgi:small subunit ribosomal protein S2
LASDLVRQLVDAGIHYGHRVSRWNPKMAPYIFAKRNTIHIIDIRETVKGMLRAKKFIARTVADGEDVLFVGTKRQARPHVLAQARRVGMPYVIERWLGGTLTNFKTIRSRLARLEELEAAEADGTAQQYSKKMIATRAREMRKIKRNLEGIREMTKLPGVLVVVDVHREHIAVREARKLGIPTVCLIDTDSDPAFADIPIPGNDDAMRAIEVVITHLADSVEEGLKGRTMVREEEGERPAPRRKASRRALARADADHGSAEAAPSVEDDVGDRSSPGAGTDRTAENRAAAATSPERETSV